MMKRSRSCFTSSTRAAITATNRATAEEISRWRLLRTAKTRTPSNNTRRRTEMAYELPPPVYICDRCKRRTSAGHERTMNPEDNFPVGWSRVEFVVFLRVGAKSGCTTLDLCDGCLAKFLTWKES